MYTISVLIYLAKFSTHWNYNTFEHHNIYLYLIIPGIFIAKTARIFYIFAHEKYSNWHNSYMKILSSLLIVIVTIPICWSVTASYIADIKSDVTHDVHASISLVSVDVSSEPAMMMIIGTGLIALAGIGRKRINKKNSDPKIRNDFRDAIPPHPDPVPWKKE